MDLVVDKMCKSVEGYFPFEEEDSCVNTIHDCASDTTWWQ